MKNHNNPPFYNPLDKTNLGKSVVEALLESDEFSLESFDDFFGAGIYAIYYRGNFKPYASIAAHNQTNGMIPIYIGKAIPKGGRKAAEIEISRKTKALNSRLKQHSNSIKLVENLNISDFSFRHLVVDDIWIPLGETMALQKFTPLWNSLIDGFGNHDPGSGRYGGMRPLWDELHPGRGWAAKCQAPKQSREEIIEDVMEFIQTQFG